MKCPKCAYLGFEPVERCRNCGYDFSLTTAEQTLPDLAMRPESAGMSPLDDLTLIDAASAPPPAIAMTDAGPDLDRILGATADDDESMVPALSGAARSASPSGELPLFAGRTADDQPLITRASPPRQPLSVRRATPDVARLRPEPPRPQSFELALELGESTAQLGPSYTPAARATAEVWPEPRRERAETADISTRFVAVAIDLAILLTVDIVVIYFTMQICGITLAEAGLMPRVPLLAFLLVQNGGYLVAFTAGGQTLGKMATGIRVVGTESAGELDLGRAFKRTMVWLVLAIPAGLGFLTIFGRDNRGLHDRIAGTRVVRASIF
jgi:uncharacterized RDD family membrane protein YckC